jgi:hypothetical protein
VPALVALHRSLGLWAEDAIGGYAERLLQGANVVLGLGRMGARMVPLGDGVTRREAAQSDRCEHGQQNRPGGGGQRRQGMDAGLRHVI